MALKRLPGTQRARRKAVTDRRERIRDQGRRVDLLLPEAPDKALQSIQQPGESATAAIIRALLHFAQCRH